MTNAWDKAREKATARVDPAAVGKDAFGAVIASLARRTLRRTWRVPEERLTAKAIYDDALAAKGLADADPGLKAALDKEFDTRYEEAVAEAKREPSE
jgi:hypothetical protein